jgi:hypothetical protein
VDGLLVIEIVVHCEYLVGNRHFGETHYGSVAWATYDLLTYGSNFTVKSTSRVPLW